MRRELLTVFMAVCLCVIINTKFGMLAIATPHTNFRVDVLLDYGNGTRTWSTSILLTPGYDTAFNATQIAADTLNYTVSGYGIFVDAINGVWNNWTSGHWWALFFWNYSSNNWKPSPVGADQLVLSDGDMIAWFYDVHPWPPFPPANPPITQVEVMLDYGNGTLTWDTVFLTGASNAFKATQATADTLNYTMYGDDVFVDAINGVWNNWTTNYYWLYWYWNSTSGSWNFGPVACNKYLLNEGDVIAWYYETDPWGPPPPPSHALTVYSSPAGVAFTVDSVSYTTPWSGNYREDTSVSLIMPETHTVGGARYYWNRWSDGDNSRSRAVIMNTNITLTAYYTGTYYELTVTSSPITGVTFTVNGVPEITPYTEWLPEGSYTLEMRETHNGYVWSHWLEDGDTSRTKTIGVSGTTWTGVYVPAAPPPAVGGEMILVKIHKPPLPALEPLYVVGLVSLIITVAVSVVYVKHRKK